MKITSMRNAITLTVTLVALVLGSFAGTANADIFVLDDTNNYSVDIGSGITVSQGFPSNGAITFTGGSAALGASDEANFANAFTQIGSSVQPGGNRPQDFVTESIAFTIQADSDSQLFDAIITYFAAPNGNVIVGTAPAPDNNAGLVFQVTTAVPEPSSALLCGFASLSLLLRRSRKK